MQNTTTARNEMLRKVETHKKNRLGTLYLYYCIPNRIQEKKNNYTDPTSLRSLLHTHKTLPLKKLWKKQQIYRISNPWKNFGAKFEEPQFHSKIKARESRWTQCAAAYRRKMQSITKQYLNLLDENNGNKRNLRK